ncbi:MAG TPA: chemotaxis protein CheW, partial [Gammaproteobacteria bacterium]|nr:chemotaxis protein CheW [Gammaproteobacteria bacterium]
MAAQPHRELYSLLIPLKGERLLVPRMCVAEVIAFVEAARDRDDQSPEWFLGTIEWNGRRLPVVSFDDVRSEERKSKRGRTR